MVLCAVAILVAPSNNVTVHRWAVVEHMAGDREFNEWRQEYQCWTTADRLDYRVFES